MTGPASSNSEPHHRIAVVGAGPAGFYASEALLKQASPSFSVDLFERLPMPYGLVRYGVAPDHQKIKSVTRAFDKTAQHPRFRLLANVSLGKDVDVAELRARYAAVILCVGCETDRKLGTPGEEQLGCYPATRFVAWYNGHPEFRDYDVKLDARHAVVIGAGDVALDITRMLLQPPAQLAATDIAPYALPAFVESRVKKVSIVIRRGPAQTPFAIKELRDIAELGNVKVVVDAEPVRSALADSSITDSGTRRKLEYLDELSKQGTGVEGDARTLELLFLRSPVALLGDGGRVTRVQLEKNQLVETPKGQQARGTGQFEVIEAGLVFPAVGYRGVPLPNIPFDEDRGIIPNRGGRVTDATGQIVPGLYAAGWIKRGPSGVIGTNKADASDTVQALLEDLAQNSNAPQSSVAEPSNAAKPSNGDIDVLLAQRGVRVVTFADWQRLDALECQNGERLGKVREKFGAAEAALAALKAAE